LFLWMIAVMLIATSCNDNQPSTQQIAISKVANYAQNGNQAPTIQDYIDAGVGGVNADTIDDVNGLILGLEREDVDTATEIQAIIDRLGINLEENITAGDIANQINETNTTDEENVSTSPNEDNETNASETFVPPSEETNTSEPSIDESKPATQENTTNESENNTTTPQEETNETNASETSVPPKEETNTTIENNETNQSVVTPPSEETNTTEENTTIEQPQEETNTTEETNTSTPPVAVVDTTPPTITILGTNPITIEALSSYSDEGATVDEDNSTLNQSGEVNTSKVGVYTITYKAVDSSGNSAEANRTVNVVDTTKPTITLNGNASLTLTKGSVYNELGAIAMDNLDGELNVTIDGSVNTSANGTYILTYSAVDKSGNEANVTRSVSVYTPYTPPPADTTPPVITLNGASSMTIEKGGVYTELGATTNEGAISTSGSVDTSTIGVYTITYSATDNAGNSANKARTINVVAPNIAPEATAQSLSVNEDSSDNTITLAGTDGNSDSLTFTVVTNPSHGTLSGTAPDMTYKPAKDYNGSDSFTFKANDGTVDSATATISLSITSVNDAPIANAGEDKNITQGESVVLNGSATDIDGSINSYEWSLDTNSSYTADTQNITVSGLALGTHIFTLSTMDDWGEEDSDTVKVIVKALLASLKKTGQTKSYDTSGTEITDGSIKDDGYYQKGTAHSYTRDDVKEIVTDNVTGLMWQDDGFSLQLAWIDAVNYCLVMSLGGFDDWRPPTSAELENIVDYGRVNPSINPVFQNTSSDYYWSSTTSAGSSDYAWLVDFYHGYVGYGSKDNSTYVRCVRVGG